jgi:hypothetical protein
VGATVPVTSVPLTSILALRTHDADKATEASLVKDLPKVTPQLREDLNPGTPGSQLDLSLVTWDQS